MPSMETRKERYRNYRRQILSTPESAFGELRMSVSGEAMAVSIPLKEEHGQSGSSKNISSSFMIYSRKRTRRIVFRSIIVAVSVLAALIYGIVLFA